MLGGMAERHALEHVFEVGIGLDPVELCRGEKRGDDGPSIRAAVGLGEQMVFSPQSHLGVILPMSGRLRWFTIAGIHCLGGRFADFIVSAAHRASWFTSRWSRALSWSCLAGCSIR